MFLVLVRSYIESFLFINESLFPYLNEVSGSPDVTLRKQQHQVSEVCQRDKSDREIHSNIDDLVLWGHCLFQRDIGWNDVLRREQDQRSTFTVGTLLRATQFQRVS